MMQWFFRHYRGGHEGVTHESFGMGAEVADARTAVQQAGAGLRGGVGR